MDTSGDLAGRSLPPGEDDRSLGELFGELSRDMSGLVRKELELAKAELSEEASRAGKAAGVLGAAGVAGLLALLLLSFAAAWGLAEVMPTGVAFLIVGAVYAVAAFVLLSSGRGLLRRVRPIPDQTVQTLKEDVQWAKTQLS